MGVWGPWEGTHPGVAGVAPSGVSGLKWPRAAWGLPCPCPQRTMLSSLVYWYLSKCGDNRDRGGSWLRPGSTGSHHRGPLAKPVVMENVTE